MCRPCARTRVSAPLLAACAPHHPDGIAGRYCRGASAKVRWLKRWGFLLCRPTLRHTYTLPPSPPSLRCGSRALKTTVVRSLLPVWCVRCAHAHRRRRRQRPPLCTHTPYSRMHMHTMPMQCIGCSICNATPHHCVETTIFYWLVLVQHIYTRHHRNLCHTQRTRVVFQSVCVWCVRSQQAVNLTRTRARTHTYTHHKHRGYRRHNTHTNPKARSGGACGAG